MSSIDGSSRSQSYRPTHTPERSERRADPSDVRAMRDALDAAKGRLEKAGGQPGQSARKQAAAMPGERGRGTIANYSAPEPAVLKQASQRDGTEALAGWNGLGTVPVVAGMPADVAAPHVDPSAFAQMLADLWTRENGRGSKEVRVRFGDRSWPATGARLVRNAAGGLDVALLVGDGGRAYGDHLPGLEDALIDAGVQVGSVAIEQDS